MLELSINNSLENVHGEEVDVPNGVRYISDLLKLNHTLLLFNSTNFNACYKIFCYAIYFKI